MTIEAVFESEEKTARLAAKILGNGSAAHAAICDLENRRIQGEDAVIWKSQGTYYVGPRPAQTNIGDIRVH